MTDPRRNLPGIDVLLASEPVRPLLTTFPRARVVDALRRVLVQAREELASGTFESIPPAGDPHWASRAETLLQAADMPSLRSVINATGVVLHTNLGRAPLSEAARTAMAAAGVGYSNLEFDLEAGERGSRYVHCVELLREITGAPDALVVNNNAAAVVLGLNTMAAGKGVLVSRGELVEIGGGFRIPDMLSRSGAILREVGTTNRTRADDYREAAAGGDVGAILKVHRSNFRISGFTEEAALTDLSAIAEETGAFLFHDLGSGLLADPASLGLPTEPRAPESLKAGAHAVAISGDKLLGGPQAGIVLGRPEVIGPMRKNPLCRAFRVDKVTLAGLEATLKHYLDPDEALAEIPALRMLSASLADLERRARGIAAGVGSGGVSAVAAEGSGMVGGGTFPGVELPGWTVRVGVDGRSSQEIAARLRALHPPVVGRIENDDVVFDVRTVDPEDDETLVSAIREAARVADRP
jgi:L-seryl-tRNA(Ser) seleniumtransferase